MMDCVHPLSHSADIIAGVPTGVWPELLVTGIRGDGAVHGYLLVQPSCHASTVPQGEQRMHRSGAGCYSKAEKY